MNLLKFVIQFALKERSHYFCVSSPTFSPWTTFKALNDFTPAYLVHMLDMYTSLMTNY